MDRVRKFFYYISKKKLTIGSAAFIIGATYLVNNFLGLIREIIIANKFGAERTADIFFASFKIPDFIFQLLILGALSSAFIPVLVESLTEKGEDEGQKVANSVLNLFLIAAVFFAIIMYFLVPYIVPIVFKGFFKYTQETGFDVYKVTVNTTRLMLLSPIFFCLSGIFSGILNSYKRFVAYSLAPVVYNISIIFSALFLTSYFKVPVYGLAVGVILGAVLHMLVQLPAVLRTGYRYRPIIYFYKGKVDKIIRLMIPRTITIGIGQINILVDSFVASFFIGGISVITYANDIQTVPSVVFGIAIATAIFPYLAESYAKKDMAEFLKSFSWSFRRIMFFLIPATFGIIALRAQIVRLIFGFGQFNVQQWESTKWTTMTLLFFIISLVAQGVIPLIIRAFYAIKDTKTPLYIGIFVMILNAVLTLTLPFHTSLGIAAVALAFSVASFANMGLLLFYLHKKIGILDKDHKIFASTLRLVFASGLMALVIKGSLYFFDTVFITERVFGLFFQTVSSIGIATIFYLSLAYLLKCEEINFVIDKFHKKAAVIVGENKKISSNE
ncbi:MAG: murein biosynthesis integral membrane protein MurJ [Patescibacteria group bacterium]|nr:murein biosynthesis integral membrane protein MurJ [Patescibacteria group bacterium]